MKIPVYNEYEANSILRGLNYFIEIYGVATMSDLYGLQSIGYHLRDTKVGWTNLNDSKIIYDPLTEINYLVLPETNWSL